jgi:hypothetical protein
VTHVRCALLHELKTYGTTSFLCLGHKLRQGRLGLEMPADDPTLSSMVIRLSQEETGFTDNVL